MRTALEKTYEDIDMKKRTLPRETYYAANRAEAFNMMLRRSELMTGRKPHQTKAWENFYISQYAVDSSYKRYHMKLDDGQYVRTYVYKWKLDN